MNSVKAFMFDAMRRELVLFSVNYITIIYIDICSNSTQPLYFWANTLLHHCIVCTLFFQLFGSICLLNLSSYTTLQKFLLICVSAHRKIKKKRGKRSSATKSEDFVINKSSNTSDGVNVKKQETGCCADWRIQTENSFLCVCTSKHYVLN